MVKPTDPYQQEPIFKWETMREVGPDALPFKEPVHGKILEVELTSGHKVNVFRADDGQFYFCHGLTFGGKQAPGGAVSPFSGKDVQTIVDNHYGLVDPQSAAVAGDILVWRRTRRRDASLGHLDRPGGSDREQLFGLPFPTPFQKW